MSIGGSEAVALGETLSRGGTLKGLLRPEVDPTEVHKRLWLKTIWVVFSYEVFKLTLQRRGRQLELNSYLTLASTRVG